MQFNSGRLRRRAICRSLARVLCALSIAGAVPLAAAASPDPQLLEAARQAQPALIETLKEMVLIESGSTDAAGLAKMARYTERRLKALGAKTAISKGAVGASPIVTATFTGSGSRRIMLIAHLDTVYPPGTLQIQPYRVDGGRIHGPGIADDKGGIAVILHALKILGEAGWHDYARLTVLFNTDEEIGSLGSGELIANLAAEHDYVLSCEPSPDIPEGLLLGASGTGTVVMQVRGRAAHAGAAPETGRNALIELSHQMLQTEDIAKAIPGTQLNWTVAQGGLVRNQIPERAFATGDLRLTIPDGFAKIEAALRERVKTSLIPDTDTTISIESGRPPFVASAAARELALTGQDIYAEIGRTLTLIDHTGGATDAGYAARSGKAIVLESFGLPGAGYHARDEYIVIDSIVPRLYLMTRMLKEIGRK